LGKKKGSGNNLGKVLFPHFFARLPDRGKDVFRGHKALVIFHVEKSALLVEGHLGDARDLLDCGAHGAGAARSEDAALFLHATDPEGELR
jgi:hypothetical protein